MELRRRGSNWGRLRTCLCPSQSSLMSHRRCMWGGGADLTILFARKQGLKGLSGRIEMLAVGITQFHSGSIVLVEKHHAVMWGYCAIMKYWRLMRAETFLTLIFFQIRMNLLRLNKWRLTWFFFLHDALCEPRRCFFKAVWISVLISVMTDPQSSILLSFSLFYHLIILLLLIYRTNFISTLCWPNTNNCLELLSSCAAGATLSVQFCLLAVFLSWCLTYCFDMWSCRCR